MKKVNKKVLKVVEHVMRNEAVYGIDRFPPACMGIFHQPKRSFLIFSAIISYMCSLFPIAPSSFLTYRIISEIIMGFRKL